MRKVSLRNLAAHKLRLLLTVLSVVLGTSFVAGSMIFTTTVKNSFNGIFDQVAVGVDAQISPKDSGTLGVPDSLIATIEKDKRGLGVDQVVTTYTAPITIAAADGKALSTGGAPSVGSGYLPPAGSLDPSSTTILPGGRAPRGSHEVAINESAAKKAGLQVGSRTQVVVGTGSSVPMTVTVVGLEKMAGATSGYTEVDFAQPVARQLFSDGRHASTVQLSAVAGVSPEQLTSRIEKITPSILKVQTGAEVRQSDKDSVNQFLDVFNYILLAFAAIGLIVGTFIIYNTFSMIVAQRVREMALLRAIGTSRRQLTRAVLLEAFVVGLVGSAVGLGAGVGIAAALQALTASSGLPQGSLMLGVSPVVACLLVGVVVTMVSAYAPARRASQVSPVEAMRESQTDGQASILVRTLIAAVLAAIAAVLVAVGASGQGGNAATTVGIGAMCGIIAVVLGAPALAGPVVGLLGRIFAAPFGKIGRLARTNAMRNRRRTAATAFALTLGLMLVAVIGTLGSSFKGSIDHAVDAGLNANLVITDSQGVLRPQIAQQVAKVDGIASVVRISPVAATVDGKQVGGSAAHGDLESVTPYTMLGGASSTIPPNGIIVSSKTSADKGWHRGDTVTFTSLAGATVPVTVTGVYRDAQLLGPWQLGEAAYQKLVPKPLQQDSFVLVKTEPGVSQDAVQARIGDVTDGYLTVKVQNRAEFKGQQSSQIDTMLTVLYAMLGLALVIAVLGIVNTLALSVVERKREIGMLRAVGMARAQVRRTIYLESFLIAVFGALLGMVIGVFFGWGLARTFRQWGLTTIVLPWNLIAITMAGAAVAGVLAALWPAIRAARTKPLEAIADL
ncbi:FtsX-like permease family protein [Leekyejoonella antrihumi]|uniref:FtsX-like permease family protein n=2 Tax=Leekyejoonella antrihumi TaxID=1660198 RepID=A0A563DU94_9MICO|nr:FtsX-like permease family protein [Leekyejoonella antrihumi]